MTQPRSRTFEDRVAVRSHVPLWIGVGGPSGGGKTLSAIRLATGIQRVTGGEIYVIDTEADRAGHYAPRVGEKPDPPRSFAFRHISFGAPFGSLDYLDAVNYCVSKGAKIVITDSFSHEHEGVGGMLETFEEELERMSRGDEKRAERMKMLAWKKPKADRRRMINEMLQMQVHVIGCFRCKDKLKMQKGEDPKRQGYMPITGDEFIFEFPTRLLLASGSDGAPRLDPTEPGERDWVRIPAQFRDLFSRSRQLDEETGQRMAEWAAGGATASTPAQKASVGDEKRPILKDIGALVAKLGWDKPRSRAWLGETFDESDPAKLTVMQLEDARTLMSALTASEEDYRAELDALVDLGRAKTPQAAA